MTISWYLNKHVQWFRKEFMCINVYTKKKLLTLIKKGSKSSNSLIRQAFLR